MRSGVPRLLAELAAASEPISHDKLDTLPATAASHYARDLLTAAGVLRSRNEHLERLPAWADRLLAEAPTHHKQLVTPFVHWYLLRRARRADRRRPTRSGSAAFLRSRVRRSLELLAWLDERGQTLAMLTQPDLEQWLIEGASTRRHVDAFISWGRGLHVIGDVRVPPRPKAEPVRFIDESDRGEQLRRCLTDDDLPLDVRVAGALILLFGLLSSRVAHLSKSDITDDGQMARLNLDGHQLQLPPRLAALVRRQRDETESRWRLNQLTGRTPWLFPGRSPSRPVRREYFTMRLAQHGLTVHAGRNTARLALAGELPASVLADLTGTSIGNAVAWTAWAKRDWIDYVASRQHALPGAHPTRPATQGNTARPE